jgi:hypothetical protein
VKPAGDMSQRKRLDEGDYPGVDGMTWTIVPVPVPVLVLVLVREISELLAVANGVRAARVPAADPEPQPA